jgi:endonuclease G
MKNLYKFLIGLVAITTLVFANPIDDKASQFVVNGAPVSKIVKDEQYLIKKVYAIHYRYDTKTAEYVVEHPSKEDILGGSKRQDDFRPDPEVPNKHQSQLSDYAGNPYDRGHLVPAGDCTKNAETMSESFFLTNMVPQVPNHNRGIWKQLETCVRNWIVDGGKDLYVISGTIYNKDYKTIGGNKVGVPDYLWKIIIDKKTNKSISFLFPNAPLPVEDLPKYIVSISEIEVKTRIDFNPKMSASQQKEFEASKADQKDWSGLIKK